jgi:hypothetical protein
VVESRRRRVSDCVVGSSALSIWVVAEVSRTFVERALAKERHRPLIALLLQSLRAHRTEETVGCERDVGSTCRCRRPALRSHATSSTGGPKDAVHASSRCLRPSLLVSLARLCGCDGRGPRRRKARLSQGPGHAQDAAAGRGAVSRNVGVQDACFVVVDVVGGGGGVVFANGLVIVCDHGGMRGGVRRRRRRHGRGEGAMVPRMGVSSMASMQVGALWPLETVWKVRWLRREDAIEGESESGSEACGGSDSEKQRQYKVTRRGEAKREEGVRGEVRSEMKHSTQRQQEKAITTTRRTGLGWT